MPPRRTNPKKRPAPGNDDGLSPLSHSSIDDEQNGYAANKRQNDAAETRLREREQAMQRMMDALQKREEQVGKREDAVSAREKAVLEREAKAERSKEAASSTNGDIEVTEHGEEGDLTDESIDLLEGVIKATSSQWSSAESMQTLAEDSLVESIKILAAAFKRVSNIPWWELEVSEEALPIDQGARLLKVMNIAFSSGAFNPDNKIMQEATKWVAFAPLVRRWEMIRHWSEAECVEWHTLVKHLNHDRSDLTRADHTVVLMREATIEWISDMVFRRSKDKEALLWFCETANSQVTSGKAFCIDEVMCGGDYGYSSEVDGPVFVLNDTCNCCLEHLRGTKWFCPTISRGRQGDTDTIVLGFRTSSCFRISPLTWEDLPGPD